MILIIFSHIDCNRVSLLIEKISEDGCISCATGCGFTPLSKEVSTKTACVMFFILFNLPHCSCCVTGPGPLTDSGRTDSNSYYLSFVSRNCSTS